MSDDLFAMRRYNPLIRWPDQAFYCPACHCNKSGDIANPNGRTEACDNDKCQCHDEDIPEAN